MSDTKTESIRITNLKLPILIFSRIEIVNVCQHLRKKGDHNMQKHEPMRDWNTFVPPL